MKEQKLLNEVFDYITGDSKEFNSVQITDKLIDIKLALYRLEKLETPPTENEIKVGDKYTANGNEWEITGIDDEGIHLVWTDYLINVDDTDENVYVYRRFKNGNTRGIYWAFSFDEIKMVNEIIDKLKGMNNGT